MGIQPLSPTIVQLIRSSQVLTNPVSVVKELVDNAIDARATSIIIEISKNTLDVIQVRDNGHGVAPADRQSLAKRHCTSKLVSFDELDSVGVLSLGFRGEALASIAELSGSLSISTRVEGEQLASTLHLGTNGDVISETPSPLPVGTTVRINDYLKPNPVRRQSNLKSAGNIAKEVKTMLQAYAFARPGIRFSLKIFKTPSSPANWSYAPQTADRLKPEDVVCKIVGTACASQCTTVMLDQGGYTFTSVLPRRDADISKVRNLGFFISVDSRPVSSTKGLFKEVCKTFRNLVRSSIAKGLDVQSPFMQLNIACPTGSYDVNIEPAKDDVLFENGNAILDAIAQLFESVYGPAQQDAVSRVPLSEYSISSPSLDIEPVPSLDETRTSSTTPRSTESPRSPEEPEATAQEAGEEHDRRNIKFDNPWVLAKLHTTQRRPDGPNSFFLKENTRGSPDLTASRALTGDTDVLRLPNLPQGAVLSSSPDYGLQVSQGSSQVQEPASRLSPTASGSLVESGVVNSSRMVGPARQPNRSFRPFVQPLRNTHGASKPGDSSPHDRSRVGTDLRPRFARFSPDADTARTDVGYDHMESRSTNDFHPYQARPVARPGEIQYHTTEGVGHRFTDPSGQDTIVSGQPLNKNSRRQLRQGGMRKYLRPLANEHQASGNLQNNETQVSRPMIVDSPEPDNMTSMAPNHPYRLPSRLENARESRRMSPYENGTHAIGRACTRRLTRSKSSKLPLESIPQSHLTKSVILRLEGPSVSQMGKECDPVLDAERTNLVDTGYVWCMNPFGGDAGELGILRARIRDQLVQIQAQKSAIDARDILKSIQDALSCN